MLKQFKTKSRTYGVIAGKTHSVITERDFCHEIIPNNEGIWVDGEAIKVREIIAKAEPIESLPIWAHYWGIKPRVRNNYKILLNSIKEIGVDVSEMPEWEESRRTA